MFDWMTNSIILWMVVIIASVAIEAFTLDLTSLWFSFGGVAALLAASLGAGWLAQLIIFTAVSAVLLVLVRPVTRRLLKPKGARTNADRILGEEAVVTVPIDNTAAQGEIKLMGQVWSARSADGAMIPQGSRVRVREIVGVKAIVEAMAPEKEEKE